MNTPLSRRDFLGQSSCAAVGSLGLLSTLLNLRMANSAVAQTLPPGEDYRALVCFFFSGGIDSYNLLVPNAGSAVYDNYVNIRGGLYDGVTNVDGLAISGLPLAAHPTDPFAFGVHPSCGDYSTLPGIRSLYGSGNLAFISNVGTLVERITKAQYDSSTARLPRGLFSHADQIQQWQTSVPTEARALGWAGSAADLLHAGNVGAKVSMNISISGNNIWQSGRKLFAYTIGNQGSSLPDDYNSILVTPDVGRNSRIAIRTSALDNMLQQEYQNLLDQTYSVNLRESIEGSAEFKNAFDASTLTTPFPGDPGYTYRPGFNQSNDPARIIGQQLKAIVRTIKARQALNMRRQTFFINYGGWDHHDEVINNMNNMVDIVNRCLISYWQALGEIGVQDKVTLYTASDFARTLTSNGAGSDHAWGGNSLVLGGAVNGGRVYGSYPDLALTAPNVITNRGSTLPTISVDEYFAELALWLGVSPGDLPSVLPRINTFYTPSSSAPIGFMQP
ncbi:MAG: DUF1501 domain-containing protein [Akkermansiaceae bacterium]|nr:DUF1501 domain-containing protein [Akkermansiaceae bacterium]NJR41705.1 DUF1501 domain-containing protein [Akkermansiaceae bacterium]